jgi:hypothetical protein
MAVRGRLQKVTSKLPAPLVQTSVTLFGREVVVGTVDLGVHSRVVSREDEGSVGGQDPAEFSQRAHPVIQVVKDQGGDRQVEVAVGGKSQGFSEITHQDSSSVAQPYLGQSHHRRADVQRRNYSAVVHQPLGERSCSAADLEDPLAHDIAEQFLGGRPLVVGIEGAFQIVCRVCLGHRVVLGCAPRIVLHGLKDASPPSIAPTF